MVWTQSTPFSSSGLFKVSGLSLFGCTNGRLREKKKKKELKNKIRVGQDTGMMESYESFGSQDNRNTQLADSLFSFDPAKLYRKLNS